MSLPDSQARRAGAAPNIELFASNPVPLYYQLTQRIEEAASDNDTGIGLCLGTSRELAARLRLSHATVRRAYRILEGDGFAVVNGIIHGPGSGH